MENDTRKFTIISFILFSALVGLIAYLLASQIMFSLKIGGSSVLWGLSSKQLAIGAGSLVGVLLMVILSTNKTTTSFIDEVFSELQKTTWPNARETSLSTVVVSILIGIAALVLFFMDSVWGLFFRTIL